ncbi:MAG: hypothetical protein LYZ69_08665 [Nitrososphaerales archaeon]|nr:hypothetical protein [Nitrososphaerales archaeon]
MKRRETLPIVPECALPDALASLETIRSQDKLLRRLINAELEPLQAFGQGKP